MTKSSLSFPFSFSFLVCVHHYLVQVDIENPLNDFMVQREAGECTGL